MAQDIKGAQDTIQETKGAQDTNAITKADVQRPARRRTAPDVFEGMWHDMDRLLSLPGFTGPSRVGRARRGRERLATPLIPRVDVFEQGNDIVVRAEMPGMKKDDISVDLDQGDLVIRGELKEESEVNEEDYYRMERSYGSFYRRIPLPDGVNEDQIKASYNNGVLEVRVPKPSDQQSTTGTKIPIR
jgi:HSP20 family protein